MRKKAIFLDRDGTINEDVGYLYKIKDLVLIPGAIEAMKLLQDEFLLFIITNQQGISQKEFSESDFIDFNSSFIKLLEEKGVLITEVYFCPHTKVENCICRKPSAYFIEKAEKDYDLDIKESYIIGDHPSDIETSLNIDINTIYLLSGHGSKHLNQLRLQPDHIAVDLYNAAIWVNTKNNDKKNV